MARMRSIKPEFWSDRALSRLSRDARLLYVALWNQADEHARMHGDPRYVKGHCLPYDDDLDLADIADLLGELEDAGRVQQYEADGDPYLFLPKLAQHQRLEAEKVPSRLPAPPPVSTDPHPDPKESESRADESVRRADESERIVALQVAGSREHESGRAQTSSRGGRLPDPFIVSDEMRQWAHEHGYDNQAIAHVTAAFCDYWRGAPGAKGRKSDWPATWRNWLRREAERRPQRGGDGRGFIGHDGVLYDEGLA